MSRSPDFLGDQSANLLVLVGCKELVRASGRLRIGGNGLTHRRIVVLGQKEKQPGGIPFRAASAARSSGFPSRAIRCTSAASTSDNASASLAPRFSGDVGSWDIAIKTAAW